MTRNCLECDNPIEGKASRGMCRKCYKTWHHRVTRHGEDWPHPKQLNVNQGKRCRRCRRWATRLGLCDSHYWEMDWERRKFRATGFWEQVDRHTEERLAA